MLDLRARQSPIKDQGGRNTCVAFAMTAGHEMLRDDGEDLSEEFLHWAAKQPVGSGASAKGTTLAAAANALANLGQPLEYLWPYDDTRNEQAATYHPPAGVHAAAASRCLHGGHVLPPIPAALRHALDQGLAVLLGVQLFATWYGPLDDGRIALPTKRASVLGGHAVLLVGYDGDAGASDYFIIRNSWGADWGEGGYAYLPDAYIDAHGLQAWGLST